MADTNTPELTDDEATDAPGAAAAGGAKEFRIVVRSQDRRGPLAPYRLTIAVAAVALVFGPALYSGIVAGSPDDGLLLRAGLIGILVWIMTGIVSAALADAGARTDANAPGTP